MKIIAIIKAKSTATEVAMIIDLKKALVDEGYIVIDNTISSTRTITIKDSSGRLTNAASVGEFIGRYYISFTSRDDNVLPAFQQVVNHIRKLQAVMSKEEKLEIQKALS